MQKDICEFVISIRFASFEVFGAFDPPTVHNIPAHALEAPVEEDAHGREPAEPAWGEVTGDNQLAVITRDNHEGRAETKSPSLAAALLWGQLHHQEDLDQKEWHCEEPIHVSEYAVEAAPPTAPPLAQHILSDPCEKIPLAARILNYQNTDGVFG